MLFKAFAFARSTPLMLKRGADEWLHDHLHYLVPRSLEVILWHPATSCDMSCKVWRRILLSQDFVLMVPGNYTLELYLQGIGQLVGTWERVHQGNWESWEFRIFSDFLHRNLNPAAFVHQNPLSIGVKCSQDRVSSSNLSIKTFITTTCHKPMSHLLRNPWNDFP